MFAPRDHDANSPTPPQQRREPIDGVGREANPVWGQLALRPAVIAGAGHRVQLDSDSAASPDTAPATAAPAATPTAAPYGVIVEDDAEPREGQIKRSAFLAGLAPDLEAIANSELASIGLTAAGCQYIPYWLGYYSQRSAAHIERVIARFADPQDRTPSGLREALMQRVRRAVQEWVESDGNIVDVPEGVDLFGSDDAVSESEAAPAKPMAKSADGSGGPISASDPAAVQARLSEGQPLEGPTRERMERGFGESFADVRLHTDGGAARMASSYSAHAFTVGHDVAFASGQYRPGTLAGDVLIAHELAHVVQQRGGGRASGPASDVLEENADLAAAAAIGRTEDGLELDPELFGVPQMSHSGLRLQRCSTSSPPTVAPELLGNATLGTMSEQQLLDRFDRLVAAERALRTWRRDHTSATADTQIDTLVRQAELLAQEFASRHTAQPGESQRTFSPQAVARMRTFFEGNVAAAQPLACINTVRAGLSQLYDAGATGTPASVTRGLRMTTHNTIEETMEQMRAQGLASPAREVYFRDATGRQITNNSSARPERLASSVWDAVTGIAGTDSNYSVFGMSLLDGYHSVTLTVDSRIPGRPRVYWSDQTSHHDSGWEEYQRGASTHATAFQSGSPRGIDEYIEFAVKTWWDAKMQSSHVAFYPVVRLWRLNQPPPPPPPPPPPRRPRPQRNR